MSRRVQTHHRLSTGRTSVALYVSGQLLTEDYYVANKLMKGFIGTANIDTNSRLCMSSAVAGHKRAFGEDLVPVCYEDLELADLVVLVGSNTAWCHPIVFQRIVEGPGGATRYQDRRHRSAAYGDLRVCGSASAGSRGYGRVAVQRLLAYLHQHGVVAREFMEQQHVELRSCPARGREHCRRSEVCCTPVSHRRTPARRVLFAVRAHRNARSPSSLRA